MKLAILCSGQGAQHPDMFRLTRDAAPRLFEQASALLGMSVHTWLKRADASMLRDNRSAQILCALQPLAAQVALNDALAGDCCVAGYSVGEVAAWGVAGLIEPVALLNLIAARGELMSACNPMDGAMLFVRGLDQHTIERLCTGDDAAIAIVNPGNAYVIGGRRQKLLRIALEAMAAGASRVSSLPVNVASHTPLLADAAVAFRQLATKVVSRSDLQCMRVFSGIDGAPVTNIGAGVDKLARQIAQPVRWDACMAACLEEGATAFLELGPGQALSDMAAASYPQFPARSVEDFRSIDGVKRWLDTVARLKTWP
ncbi:ACP S-malonyltransferase [Paraburkholderia rhizosphaerae]|uniref:[acyl-carrier-protein] S-malonyltransferase n=1 Tax=Paraburkholderia rhizosphaerae TaxID=480658 RepID=A0A4R8M2U9_9BURK|nr:acyltransferase domain-containing protein [Paraburkholderia rhizosphaerae]TDY54748.1 [acyl-carrier-protein] S-malonyltransferase [Paraburkholderia rhizosphaerae]